MAARSKKATATKPPPRKPTPADPADIPLRPRQRDFVREYLVDLNASAAARRAGYSEVSARMVGCENLTKPNIARAIAQAMAERAQRTEITADRVLQELARLAFFDPRKFFRRDGSLIPVTELDDDTARAVAGIEATRKPVAHSADGDEEADPAELVKIKLADKRASLELLGKHLGLFTDRLKVDATVTAKVIRVPRKEAPQDDDTTPERVG